MLGKMKNNSLRSSLDEFVAMLNGMKAELSVSQDLVQLLQKTAETKATITPPKVELPEGTGDLQKLIS